MCVETWRPASKGAPSLPLSPPSQSSVPPLHLGLCFYHMPLFNASSLPPLQVYAIAASLVRDTRERAVPFLLRSHSVELAWASAFQVWVAMFFFLPFFPLLHKLFVVC